MRYPRPKKNGDKLAVLVLVVFGFAVGYAVSSSGP